MTSISKSDAGFGIIGLILGLGAIALLVWYVAGRLGIEDVDEGQEAASQVIDQAQDTVDKANEVGERAGQLIPN